jgi:hypothetical protein
MRALARDLSASTTNDTENRLELRPLTQPLYRYQSTDPEVVDGELFAFVTSTDAEALLVIEARKPAQSAEPGRQYAICRFTDLALSFRHKGKEIFTAPLVRNAPRQDPKHRYRSYPDREISVVEDARMP